MTRPFVLMGLLCLVLNCPAESPQKAADIGIYVGVPKPFDSRTLTLRLDDLQRRLNRLRGVDETAPLGGLGKISASTLQQSGLSVTVSGGSVPDTQVKETILNDVLRPSEVVTKTAAKDATPPTAPGGADTATATAKEPELSASERFVEQTNLEYQIATLQSFLERSIEDRLHGDGKGGKPKLQALLGFEISISPPSGTDRHIAVVEVTVKPAACKGRPNLVALMPPQKSYNTFAISKKRNDFGGAAMVGPVRLGGSWFGRSEMAYVFKASDTEAVEYGVDPGAVTFGWEFRPVLGRRAVAPGKRQMLALLSLPQPEGEKGEVQVTARAYWRPFDEKRGTSQSREAKVRLDALMYDLKPVKVYSSQESEGLRPIITHSLWTPIGAKRFAASFTGTGFFSGTRIVYGDAIADSPEKGLEITSDTAMRLTGNLADLIGGAAAVQGRYGTVSEFTDEHGFMVGEVKTLQVVPGSDMLDLDVRLFPRHPENNESARTNYLESKFLTALGTTPIGAEYARQQVKCGVPKFDGTADRITREDCLILTYRIPASLVKDSTTLSVRVPFRGEKWAAQLPLDAFRSQIELVRLGKADLCDYDSDPAACRKKQAEAQDAEVKKRAAEIVALEAARKLVDQRPRLAVMDLQPAIAKVIEEVDVHLAIKKLELERQLGVGSLTKLEEQHQAEWEKLKNDATARLQRLVNKAYPGATSQNTAAAALQAAVTQLAAKAPKPLQERAETVVFGLQGGGDKSCWRVYLGSERIYGPAGNDLRNVAEKRGMIVFGVRESLLKKFENLHLDLASADRPVVPKGQQAQPKCQEITRQLVLKIPPEGGAKPSSPVVAPGQSLSAKKGTAPLLEIRGTGLDRIKQAKFGDKTLGSIAGEGGTTLTVALTREFTAAEGPAALFLETQDSKLLSVQVDIRP